MSWLRKILNYPNKNQLEIIQDQILKVKKIVQKQEDELYKKNDKIEKEKIINDKICKKCGSDKIVDRILQTSHYVQDSYHPFTGISSGHTESGTKNINHCSDCGNEWEKYSAWDDYDIARESYSRTLIYSIERNKEYKYILELYIEPFKDFYAESFYEAFKDEISLYKCRQLLKSIFD